MFTVRVQRDLHGKWSLHEFSDYEAAFTYANGILNTLERFPSAAIITGQGIEPVYLGWIERP